MPQKFVRGNAYLPRARLPPYPRFPPRPEAFRGRSGGCRLTARALVIRLEVGRLAPVVAMLVGYQRPRKGVALKYFLKPLFMAASNPAYSPKHRFARSSGSFA